MRGVHIRADFIYRNWSPKTQATVDAVLFLLFYFPAMLFFFWSALDFTLESMGWRGWDRDWGRWEQASDSTWAPILWPARIFMPIGAFLLFLQGFPELFRAFHQMGKRREALFLKVLWPYLVLLAILFYGFRVASIGLGVSLVTSRSISRPSASTCSRQCCSRSLLAFRFHSH